MIKSDDTHNFIQKVQGNAIFNYDLHVHQNIKKSISNQKYLPHYIKRESLDRNLMNIYKTFLE